MLDVGPKFEDDLFGWLGTRGLVLDAECVERASTCVEAWNRHKSALNIVSEGAVADQVSASTASVRALMSCGCEGLFVDVGAGGGFPGLWVAACHPAPGILVEPRSRRADFLELTLAAMGRRDWRVVRARLGEGGWMAVGGDNAGVAVLEASVPQVVSARAVWDPETWWRLGSRCVGDEGLVMLHVRPDDPDVEGAHRVESVVLDGWDARLYRPRHVATDSPK